MWLASTVFRTTFWCLRHLKFLQHHLNPINGRSQTKSNVFWEQNYSRFVKWIVTSSTRIASAGYFSFWWANFNSKVTDRTAIIPISWNCWYHHTLSKLRLRKSSTPLIAVSKLTGLNSSSMLTLPLHVSFSIHFKRVLWQFKITNNKQRLIVRSSSKHIF